ncbi:unnamed protein product, partial [Discosporangium mesarthrocarpum]
ILSLQGKGILCFLPALPSNDWLSASVPSRSRPPEPVITAPAHTTREADSLATRRRNHLAVCPSISQRVDGSVDRSSVLSDEERGQADSNQAEISSSIESIKVENLVMVESANVKLGRGLIAITGETGAGKSLLSSAFGLAAGARIRGTDMVGSAGPTARIQLELVLGRQHQRGSGEVLRRLGVPLLDEGQRLKVTRVIGGKRAAAAVNGCTVKVGALRELMAPLIYTVDAGAVDLFTRPQGRLRMLDRALTPSELWLQEEVRTLVHKLRHAEARRVRLEEQCQTTGRGRGGGAGAGGGGDMGELLSHWVEELDEFQAAEAKFLGGLRDMVDVFVADWGEETLGPLAPPLLAAPSVEERELWGLGQLWPCLSEVREAMEDVEASRQKVLLAREAAVGGSNPESISQALQKIRNLLLDAEAEGVGLSQELLEETHEDLNHLEACLKSAGEKLERSVESLPVLPVTLAEVEERSARWQDLARKHGVQPQRLGAMQQQLRDELDEMVVAAEALPRAREQEQRWRKLAEEKASLLTAARHRSV